MERIERHDVLNAAFLAIILMGLALAFLYGARSLLDAVGDDQQSVTAGTDGESASGPLALDEGDAADEVETPTTTAPAASTTTVAETTTTAGEVAHAPGEVIIRVANGARRGGIAGKGTAILQQAGFQALTPGNTEQVERSVVYYQPGYQLDGDAIALLLSVDPGNVLPMPENPGIAVNEANVIIILGVDSPVG